MKIGIVKRERGFSENWIKYCQEKGIDYKLIDCYKNNVIEQLEDCDGFMWYYDMLQLKSVLLSTRLLSAIEQSGKVCFPSIYENWHYDDKVSQKYLLEAVKAPLAPTYVFFEEDQAIEWAENTKFPKVFKLYQGASSMNVRLIENKKKALRIIHKAFHRGIPSYSKLFYLKERYRKFKLGEKGLLPLLKGFYHYLKPVDKSFVYFRHRGYAYFQDFMPDNDCDIRLIVLNQNKAFAVKRYTRQNDFRASESGNYKSLGEGGLDEDILKIGFDVSKKLKMNSIAYDFVFDKNKNPVIVEMTYAFGMRKPTRACPGYWDDNLQWHEERVGNFERWMMDGFIQRVEENMQTSYTL